MPELIEWKWEWSLTFRVDKHYDEDFGIYEYFVLLGPLQSRWWKSS